MIGRRRQGRYGVALLWAPEGLRVRLGPLRPGWGQSGRVHVPREGLARERLARRGLVALRDGIAVRRTQRELPDGTGGAGAPVGRGADSQIVVQRLGGQVRYVGRLGAPALLPGAPGDGHVSLSGNPRRRSHERRVRPGVG